MRTNWALAILRGGKTIRVSVDGSLAGISVRPPLSPEDLSPYHEAYSTVGPNLTDAMMDRWLAAANRAQAHGDFGAASGSTTAGACSMASSDDGRRPGTPFYWAPFVLIGDGS